MDVQWRRLGEARTLKVGLGFPMKFGIRLIWMYNAEGWFAWRGTDDEGGSRISNDGGDSINLDVQWRRLGEARTMKVGLGFPMKFGIRLIWMYTVM